MKILISFGLSLGFAIGVIIYAALDIITKGG